MKCSLEVLEKIYLKVVESSPDAKIVINSEGEVVVFNQQAEFLFGYDRSEVIGKSVEYLLPENIREAHIGHRAAFFEEPRVREMGLGRQLVGLKRGGETFSVQIKLAPLIVPEAGLHVLAVVRPVGEKKNGGTT